MIGKLKLVNFKAFKSIEAEFKPLTVLAGLNASGKSSLIQALLLLRERLNNGGTNGVVELSTDQYSIGRQQDLFYLYSLTRDSKLLLSCCEEGASSGVSYVGRFSDYEHASIRLENDSPMPQDSPIIKTLRALQYISAARPEPMLQHPYRPELVSDGKFWGRTGENAIAYLRIHGNDLVSEHLLYDPKDDSAGSQTLRAQVNAWMGAIAPGARIELEQAKSAAAVEMRVKFAGGSTGYAYRPQNVGFGISIVLPLLVMILSAKKDDCIVLENPEAHLHPGGQTSLGVLLSRAAVAGIQIVVETHSDHVINGIRVAIKTGIIQNTQAEVLFFTRREHMTDEGIVEQTSECEQILFFENGECRNYPEGFLDEWNKQAVKLWTTTPPISTLPV